MHQGLGAGCCLGLSPSSASTTLPWERGLGVRTLAPPRARWVASGKPSFLGASTSPRQKCGGCGRGGRGGQAQAQSWAVLSCPLRWTLLSPGPCGQLPLDMDIKSNRKSFLSRGITGFHSSGRCRNAGCVCLGFVFFPRKTKQNKHRGACTLTHRADPRMLTLKPQPQHTTGAECGRLGSPL